MPRGCGRLQSVKRRAAAAADDDEDDDDNDGDIDIEEDLVYKLTEAVKKQYGTIYVHTQRKLLSCRTAISSQHLLVLTTPHISSILL